MRAVNVGGTGTPPMADLRAALAEDGAVEVASYIQSGIIVLTLAEDDPRAVECRVGALVEARFGFRPEVMAFSPARIDTALEGMPGPEPEDARHMHLLFYTVTPQADVAARPEAFCTRGEEDTLGPVCLYLHAPDGLGRSKLRGRAEQALGCSATARNLNSVRAIRALV